MEGRIIGGRYRLVRLLGKGGMGSVWLADHMTLQTPVAIKLIDSETARNPNARARFDREAQLAAKIRSPHVVQILDHGTTEEGEPYIAMECLTGESLRERLSARGRLTPAETGRIVSHICRAMSRAHESGLVHRDLKPENIFITIDGEDEIVKVLDFGVAKATDMLSYAGIDPTRTGALLGTPYYMSPEQAQGLKTVDTRSDLWALGVVVFECLTGQRPFLASALGPLIAKIIDGPIPMPSQVAADARLPAEIDAWMRKALSRNPADRFASAKELAESFLIAAGTADTFNPGASSSQLARASAPALSVPVQSSTILMTEAGPGLGTATLPFTQTADGDSDDLAATVARPSSLDIAAPPSQWVPPPLSSTARPTTAASSRALPALVIALVLLIAGGVAAMLLVRS
jgi:serine/threonine-protein kinase